MKWEWKLREARDSGIEQGLEQEKEDAIVSSLKEKLPIQLIAKIARTTVKKAYLRSLEILFEKIL